MFEAESIIDSLDLAVRQRQKNVSFRVREVARVGFSRGGERDDGSFGRGNDAESEKCFMCHFRAEKVTRQSFGLAERMEAGILNLDACE